MVANARNKLKHWISRSSLSPVLLATWGMLIVAGFIVRLYIILHAGSWWFDESLSYSFAKLPVVQSWQVFKYENNPPFYFWLLRGWGLFFGFGEIPLRLFSLVLSVFAMRAIMRLAKELFGRATGMWAGAIYAVTSLAIFSDTEARMYSLLALLIALAWFYFLKILYNKPSLWECVAYTLLAALALYTSVTALWMMLTQIVVVVMVKPSHWSRMKAWLAVVAPVILFSPWLIAFAIERIGFSKYISTGSWRYFSSSIPISVIFTEPASFFNFWIVTGSVAGLIAIVLSLAFAGWFSRHAWKRHRLAESKHLVALLGFAFPLLISALTIDLGAPRYYYESAIFFWIIAAYIVAGIVARIHTKLLLALLIVGLVVYAFCNLALAVRYEVHGNWDVAARWIDGQHPDIVLAMPKMWSAEVYGPSSSFYFLPPPLMSLGDGETLSNLQAVTRYNYNWGSLAYRLAPGQADLLRSEVLTATLHANSVIFGYQGSEAEQVILAELFQLGFRQSASFEVDGYLPETLVLLNR